MNQVVRICLSRTVVGVVLIGGVGATAPVLHCCDSVLGDPPLQLACVASTRDFILAVPFAAIGEAPAAGQQLFYCGLEQPPGLCHARLEDTSPFKSCLGKQQCEIDPALLGNPCHDATALQVRVQWSCYCDENSCAIEDAAMLPPLPLRVSGNIIVDAQGSRFRLRGVNWPGAHIVNAPEGLDRAPLSSLARLVRTLGFNMVRLTWSVNSVLTNPRVEDRVVAANPRLIGMRALDVLDEVIRALQVEGILIWLDNHMLDTDWCCDRQDCNGLWFNPRHSVEDWLAAWRLVAKRYAGERAVVGAGLKNEPRSVCGGRSWGGQGNFCNATCLDPYVDPMGCVELQWSVGPEHLRWRSAVEAAGRVVLEENPHLLVSVSGLEYSTDLTAFAADLPDLPRNHLVFEAHEYSWSTFSRWAGMFLPGRIEGHFHPLPELAAKELCNDLGERCSGVTCKAGLLDCTVRTWHSLMKSHDPAEITHRKEIQPGGPYEQYSAKLKHWWGFLLEEKVGPVFLSEFGFGHGFADNVNESIWLEHVSRYVQGDGPMVTEGGMDWAYWAFGGVQVGGTGRVADSTEGFGVLNRCWTAPANSAHFAAIQHLMSAPSRQPGGALTPNPEPA